MRKIFLPLFVISCFLFQPIALNSTVVKPIESLATLPQNTDAPVNSKAKVKEIEKALGRKLTIKEKFSLFIIKTFKVSENGSGGSTALIFGIVGAGLLILALLLSSSFLIIGSFAAALAAVIIGSVKKKSNPSDRKAHAGTLLGWITLGAIGLLLILAAILLSSWG